MSEFRYPQPANEYAFEDFCLVLMRDVWNLPSLEQFGHRGERQHGVDLLDLGEAVRGVQCKHHKPHKTLPPSELEEEVAKARGLPDEALHEYWVLTTAKKSTATQRKVREINKDHAAKGLFRVTVKFWDDIERMIDTSAAAQRHLELRPREAIAEVVRSAVGEVIGPIAGSALHADLDEAKALLTNGELSEALLILRKVRTRAWNDLSSTQKARWLTLRADIVLRQGKEREAAELLLEAHGHTPDDERAVANAIAAKRLVDDPEASTLALVARDRFPVSAIVWAAVIDSAPSADAAAAAVNALPAQLRDAPEICLAITARRDLIALFPDAPQRAVDVAPTDVRGWFHLGTHLLTAEARKLDPNSWERGPVDRSHIERAVDALSKTIDLCEGQARPALQAEALLHRATARSILGELELVRADIEAATALAPSDIHVTLARARLLLEEGSFESAIPVLRKVVQRGGAEDTDFMLASVLWNRNAAGDRDEATRLMRARAERHDDIGGAAHLMALDGLLDARRLVDATQFVDESAGRVGVVEHAVLEARLLLITNDREGAAAAATRALEGVKPQASRRQLVWVSRLLVQVARFQEALPLLARLSADVKDLDSVRAFVLCAARLGRDGEVLAACARSRGAGVYDSYLLSVELPLLDRYDPERAIFVLEEILARDVSNHGARVHLVGLAQRIERHDIVQREAPSLPSVAGVDDAEEGAAVVQILLATGRSEAAIDFAYDLLRRFFSDPHAHRAFIHAIVWRDRDGDDDATPTSSAQAEPAVAVCVRETGDSEAHWFVLEDSAVAAAGAVENEITSAHPLWSRLLGRRIGDEVEFAHGPGLSRKARVVELLPKRVFRFRDALSRWQYRFPEHQELWMVRVGNEETGEFDPSRLLELVEAQRDRAERAEDVYRSHRVPVGMFGKALGKDVFHAALHVITTPGLPLRCCFGSAEEREAAFTALDAATEIVLDPTALATLYVLDVLGALRNGAKRFVVPHSVMTVIRSFVHDAKVTERATATMGATAAGPVLHVYTDAEKTGFLDRAQRFKATLEEIAIVSPTTELANMAKSIRERFVQVLDPATLDAVAVANTPGRVLWTDDGVVAHLARTEAGASAVWTQAVLLWLLQRGLLDEPTYTRASANLVALDYTFTSISPAVVSEAARIAEWHADRWPLKQTIAQIGMPVVRPEDGAQLGAMLVRDAFTEPLPVETRQAILYAVCTSLSARGDGPTAISGLERILPRIFGLNVVGEHQASLSFRLWKAPPKIVVAGELGAR